MEAGKGEQFGTVLFDDRERPQSGWFAVAGEDAHRFEGLSDLPDNVAYLTNLRYEERKQAFSATEPRLFLQSDYLREEWDVFFARHLDGERRRMVFYGARFFARLLCLARAFLCQEHFFPLRSLRHGLHEAEGLPESIVDKEVESLLTNATYYAVRTADFLAEKEHTRVFAVDPREHALTILATPLPFGPLQAFLGPLPNDANSLDSFLSDLDAWPGLFLIRVKTMSEACANLVSYGHEEGRVPFPPCPFWVTTPDFLLLAKECSLSLEKVYLWRSKATFCLAERLALAFPKQSILSLSCGCLLENFWCALALRSKVLTTQAGKSCVNPCIPFLRAMDRILLFAKVSHLVQEGIVVTGYGNGRVRIDTGHSDPDALIACVNKEALVPSFLETGEPSSAPERGDLTSYLRSLYARNDYAVLDDIDDKIVEKLCTRFGNDVSLAKRSPKRGDAGEKNANDAGAPIFEGSEAGRGA